MTTSRESADAALVSATTLRFKDRTNAPDTRFRTITRYLDRVFTRHQTSSSPASTVLETPPGAQISSNVDHFAAPDPRSYPKPSVSRTKAVAASPSPPSSRSYLVLHHPEHIDVVPAEPHVQQAPSFLEPRGDEAKAVPSFEEDTSRSIPVVQEELRGLSLDIPNGHHLLLESVEHVSCGEWWDVFRARVFDESTGKASPVIVKLMMPAYMDVDEAVDPNEHWVLTRGRGNAYRAAYNEDYAYSTFLRPYQGTIVPRYYGLFTAYDDPAVNDEGDFPPDVLIMLLEEVESSIVPYPKMVFFSFLESQEKSEILNVYAELHKKYIHHGSIELSHIRRRTNGSIALISFEDAGHLPESNGNVCQMEINKLECYMESETLCPNSRADKIDIPRFAGVSSTSSTTGKASLRRLPGPYVTCSLDRGLMTAIVRFAKAREDHLVDPDSRLAHGAHWADAAFDQTTGLKMRHEVACQGLNHAIYSLAANVMLDEWTGSDPPGMRYFGASRKDANKVRDLGWSPPPLQNNLPGTEIHRAVRRCLTTMYGRTVPRKIQDYFRDAPTTTSGVPDGLFSNADATICVAGEEEKLAGADAVDRFAFAVSASSVRVSVFLNPETGEPRLECGEGSVIARYAAQVVEGMIVFGYGVAIFTQQDRSIVMVWRETGELRISEVIHHTANGLKSSARGKPPVATFPKTMSLALMKADVGLWAAANRPSSPSIKH